MKKETEDFLKQLGDDREAEAARLRAEPLIKEKALAESKAMEELLQLIVSEFNNNPQSERSGVKMQLEGPVQRGGDVTYLLRELIGGMQFRYPKGQVLYISIPFAQDFESMRLGIETWQNNLTTDAVNRGFGGYTPGEEPKRMSAKSYTAAAKDPAWGWLEDKGVGHHLQSSKALIEAAIHRLVIVNGRG